MSSVSAAAPSIIYLGMDVHKDSIMIAVLPIGAKTPTHVDRLPNELPKLKRYLERLARHSHQRVAARWPSCPSITLRAHE